MRDVSPSVEALRLAVEQAHRSGGGLIVALVGGDGRLNLESLAVELGLPYVNVSGELARHLLDVPVTARARYAGRRLSAIVDPFPQAVALGRLGLLHLPELRLDVIRALAQLARGRVVVAEWSGAYDGTDLVYAQPGHAEHRRWPQVAFPVVHVGRAIFPEG